MKMHSATKKNWFLISFVSFFCLYSSGTFWGGRVSPSLYKNQVVSPCNTPCCSFAVENPPKAEIQPRHLPHAAVHRAARSGDGGLSGAQLGHRGSAVAPAGPQVPQGVPVGSQRGTAGHPGGAQ